LCNKEAAGKRVASARAVNARWEWVCGERRNLLAACRTHLSDPCAVFCDEDGAREWATDEVKIVALLFVGEQKCWGELGKATATLLRPPGTQRTDRRGVE
jgi:hypothetical protein